MMLINIHFIDFSVEFLQQTFTLGHRINIIHSSDLDAFFELIMSKNVHELIVLCTIARGRLYLNKRRARGKKWKRNYNTHTHSRACVQRSGRDFSKFIANVWVCRVHVRSAIWLWTKRISVVVYISICDMRVLWECVGGCMCEPSLHSFGFIYLMSPYCRWNPTDNVFSSCGLQIRLFYVQNILWCYSTDYVYVRIHTGVHTMIPLRARFHRCLFRIRMAHNLILPPSTHYSIFVAADVVVIVCVVYLLLTINICLCGLFTHTHTHSYTDRCPKTICLFVHDFYC